MGRGHIVTGLDIGTNTMKALVAEKRGQEWEVLAYAQMPSFGLRRGAVVSIEETARNVQMLLAGIERDSGKRVGSVFVNIGGSHLYALPSDGLISVSRADQVISQEDVDRVIQAARAVNIPKNEEVFEVFPQEFIVDEQKGIKQPVGLIGVRLEAKVLLLCYFQSCFTNLSQAVVNAGLQIYDIVPSPLAAARAVLTREQKEAGVALIDIGAATTSLAVFEEGDLLHFAVIPLGSDNITKDIAIGLQTEIAIAEDVKKQYGACMAPKSENERREQARKKVEVLDRSHSLSFTKKQLVDIIEPRVSEILDLMQKELKKIGRQEMLPGGVVLTGGGAKLPLIKELAKQQLKLTSEIGLPRGIMGVEEDPALATVAGLVLSGADTEETGGRSMPLGFVKGWGSKMRRMFRVFIP